MRGERRAGGPRSAVEGRGSRVAADVNRFDHQEVATRELAWRGGADGQNGKSVEPPVLRRLWLWLSCGLAVARLWLGCGWFGCQRFDLLNSYSTHTGQSLLYSTYIVLRWTDSSE